MYTANEFKDMGNTFFKNKNFSDAINCYTNAIIKNPEVPIYYTNRALCHLKLKQWEQVCMDCQKTIDLDPNNIKAHFYKGQALQEMNLLDESICSLNRAVELSKKEKFCVGDDVAKVLRGARKKRWNELERRRIVEEGELQKELTQLLATEKLRQIETAQQHNGDDSLIISIENTYEEKIVLLGRIFDEVDDKRKKRDVPDVLCCKINYGIMTDPVITPSGVTYERKDIQEHLQSLGSFDPVTRMPMTAKDLIPNLALKEVINNFLIENPWAVDY